MPVAMDKQPTVARLGSRQSAWPSGSRAAPPALAGFPSSRHSLRVLACTGFSVLLTCALPVMALSGPAADQEFVDGLRARRLYSLAELQCRRALENSELTPRQRVDWEIELIRTYAQHAANSLPEERDARWKAAHQSAEQFLSQLPADSPGILVQVQDALTSLAEGELARMESEVAAQPELALQRARATIRQAARVLEQLDEGLAKQIARAPNGPSSAANLSAEELFALQNNVRFQLARAYRNRALCYGAGTNDRVAALTMASDRLRGTLSQLNIDDPLVWQVRLGQATCFRLMGDLTLARQALAPALDEDAPEMVRQFAAAEQARITLASGGPEKTLQDLMNTRKSLNGSCPELDFAQLQTYLALWKLAAGKHDDKAAGQWQQKATASVEYLEEKHGPYWGRRAELELLRAAGASGSAGNVDILGRTADNLYLKGQWREAITTYQRAADQARNAGDAKTAFRLEYKAALIEQKRNLYDAASKRLERISVEQKSDPEAPAAHLLAAWNAAQSVRDNAQMLDHYVALLKRHLQLWPTDPTSNTARQWLGRISESRRDWPQAVAAFTAVTADAEGFADAISAAARCWQHWLEQQKANGQSVQENVQHAVQFFESVILGSSGRWPERWTPAQRVAALAAARLRLDYDRNGYANAERVLNAALQDGQGASDAWHNTAQSLLIVALAGQPEKRSQAPQLMDRLGAGSTERLLEVITRLSSVAAEAAPDVQAELAKLQLAALDRLPAQPGQLDSRQRIRVEQIRAQALSVAGQPEKAMQVLQDLADANPKNKTIQISLAQMLLDSDDAKSLTHALDRWRLVARRLPPGSDDWYRAKYSIALAYYKRNATGDRGEALKRLRYLKATSQVDATAWKSKVNQLIRDCQN